MIKDKDCERIRRGLKLELPKDENTAEDGNEASDYASEKGKQKVKEKVRLTPPLLYGNGKRKKQVKEKVTLGNGKGKHQVKEKVRLCHDHQWCKHCQRHNGPRVLRP